MICPKCMQSDETETHIVGNGNHYVCTYDNCAGVGVNKRSQFYFKEDKTLSFPYSVIFANRRKNDFFRLPYITYAE